MKTCQNFHYSKSINNALAAINHSKGKVAVLAGGADILFDVHQRSHLQLNSHEENTGIPEMKTLKMHQDQISIRDAVTQRTITNDSISVEEHFQALPAADSKIALMPLDAMVEVATQNSRPIAPPDAPAQITLGHRRWSHLHRLLRTLIDSLYQRQPRNYPYRDRRFHSREHHPHRFSVICPK